MTQRACVFISDVDDSEVRSDCNGSQSFNVARSARKHGHQYHIIRYVKKHTVGIVNLLYQLRDDQNVIIQFE